MKYFYTTLIFVAFLSPVEIFGQNYFYIQGNLSVEQKKNINAQLKYCTALFEMKNVTFAVFRCDLPKNTNATIEYQPNQVGGRKMILIRLTKRLEEKKYLLTIAHEVIHAYQYYTGDLVRHDRTNFSWRNKNFRNVHKLEHSKRPWEIDIFK